MIGGILRAWPREDPARVSKETPNQKIHKGQYVRIDVVEQVQALPGLSGQASIIDSPVHPTRYNRIGDISFHSALAAG